MSNIDPALPAPPPGQAPASGPPAQQQAPAPGAPAPAAVPTIPPAGDPWADPATAKTEIEKLRQEAAANRVRVKELEPLAAAHRAAELAGQSDLERAQAQVAELTQQATGSTLTAARYQVALAHGLTITQAHRLVGNTKEELEADAAILRKDLGLPEPGAAPPGAGQQRPSDAIQRIPVPGATGQTPTNGFTDMNQWMAERK